MRYVYDGILTVDVERGIRDMLQKYPHVVEVSCIPENFHKWSEEVMSDTTSIGEGCMGEPYEKKHKQWGFVHKQFGHGTSGFAFFAVATEKEKFVQKFKSDVVSENPFKTEFER